MNKLIQQLAEQAGFENGHQDRNGNSLSDELEKFAELIVNECCNRMSHETISHSGYGYNQHALYQILREHFGVEK